MLLEKSEIIDDNTELKLIAQGNTSEVYLYGENQILKLFRENLPLDLIKAEYEKVICIQSELRSIPKAYKIIGYKGRYGIIYDKITGSDMINRMLTNIFSVRKYSKLPAHIHCNLHTSKSGSVCSVKDKLSMDIDGAAVLSEEEKRRVKKYLLELPDGNSLLHFDFHPGNIIVPSNNAEEFSRLGGNASEVDFGSKGVSDKEPVIIDWMTACIGDPAADVARTYLLLQYGELAHANWIVKKTALFFEGYICKIYIGEYNRISGKSDSDFKKWLLPVAAGRLMEWISDNEKNRLLKLIRYELSVLQSSNTVLN